MALHGHYQDKICHREIDLIEVLPPPMSRRCMWELARLLLVKGGNVGSSRPVSPSQPTVVVVSLVRSPVAIPYGLLAGVQAGRINAPTQKRQTWCMVPSSNEVT